MEHNNINPADPSRGHDDPRVRDGCVLRHLLTARDRSVFDRNMAMMRALGAGEPVTRVAKRYGVTRQWIHRLRAPWRAGRAGTAAAFAQADDVLPEWQRIDSLETYFAKERPKWHHVLLQTG